MCHKLDRRFLDRKITKNTHKNTVQTKEISKILYTFSMTMKNWRALSDYFNACSYGLSWQASTEPCSHQPSFSVQRNDLSPDFAFASRPSNLPTYKTCSLFGWFDARELENVLLGALSFRTCSIVYDEAREDLRHGSSPLLVVLLVWRINKYVLQ